MDFELHQFNKSFENKTRLGIMSVLMVNDSIDFVSLKQLLNLTDGNLASHTRALEELSYIESSKQFIGRKPNTSFRITELGRNEFIKHLKSLEQFIESQKT